MNKKYRPVSVAVLIAGLLLASAPPVAAYERYGYLACNSQQVGRFTTVTTYQTAHWRALDDSYPNPPKSLTASWYNGSSFVQRISYTPASVTRVIATGDGQLRSANAICTRSL